MYTIEGQAIFSFSQVASLRMLVAGIVFLPFAIVRIKKIKTVRQFTSLAIVGFSGNFFPAFLFTYAETGLSSGFAGMLNSFTPVFTVLIGYIVFKARITSFQFAGLIVSIVGVILLMIAGKQLSNHGTWVHIFAIVLATLFYSISLNTIKYTLQDFNAIEISSLAFSIIFIPALCLVIHHNTISVLESNPHAFEGLGFISILSIAGTVFALVLFNYIIRISSPLFASSVTFFIPIVAVIIGVAFGEKISSFQMASMICVLAGVLTINRIKIKTQK